MQSIKLVIQPGNWRIFSGRKADPNFAPVRDQVFERDNYTCQYCGFQAKEYQEVVNVDGNYRNNKLSNLTTACVFCTQCFFLEVVGSSYGGGKLVYLPEMQQTELNSFCHVIFCAMMNGTNYRDSAQAIYRSLKFRSQAIEDKFGQGSSNPAIFCQMFIDYGKDLQKLSQKALEDFRLLPSYAKFKIQLEQWAASAVAELAAE